ncbi:MULTISPECIES: hypothetical protein [unclassified Haladaptatus]|uniref:hypothetical protein n=1 Tax=unclassified Haladaptatus TaxID=2622732 RepID=UPI0023E7890F|nr:MULTISPECIES: hypothetical protein [unclassified Haladaptatus]
MVNPVGLVLIAFGLPAAIWPYRISRLQERLDAVGSTTPWDEVEPADWRVALTRIVGVSLCLVGLVGFLLG